jgi:hypothetical protein
MHLRPLMMIQLSVAVLKINHKNLGSIGHTEKGQIVAHIYSVQFASSWASADSTSALTNTSGQEIFEHSSSGVLLGSTVIPRHCLMGLIVVMSWVFVGY